MSMSKLSDEYYERKCFFKTETVPTQTVMKKRMSPALAKVYFNSMRPKLKEMAGLAPPMKGGGSDWYTLGDHNRRIAQFKTKKLLGHDNFWKNVIDAKCIQFKKDFKQEVDLENKKKLDLAFHQFCVMYNESLRKLEALLLNAAIKDIKRVKAEVSLYMQNRYETMLRQQATALYESYNERLLKKKDKLKTECIKNIEDTQMHFVNKIHDINLEKHMAIEKLRNLRECQNLACQVYVALKEQDECAKEMEESKKKHKKEVKLLTEQIAMKDFEIKLEKEKEKKRREFQATWCRKICKVVKKFQLFVSYSLNQLPEYADFFINTEKLLLLQLNEVMENLEYKNIFECEKKDSFETPKRQPHPYFLCCDTGFKPNIDQNLCPKHCTSSTSQLPVVIVNDRCIYAACDNFEMFTDKVTQYIHGKRGNDEDFVDDYDYDSSFPINCSPSDQIQHLKLESSLMQLLQNEWANIRNLPIKCCSCRIPYCFCSRLEASSMLIPTSSSTSLKLESVTSGNKIVLRSVELEHEREPKWESYMEYVKSKKCKCAKMAKKHLEDHLPPYMRQMSHYVAPELPHYEMCDLNTLKNMVRHAHGKRTPPPQQQEPEPNTRDAETQYCDVNYEYICTCFSDDEVNKLFKELALIKGNKMFDPSVAEAQCKIVTGSITPSYLAKSTTSFATERAQSLKNLLSEMPKLEDIFRKKDCNFD